MSLVEVAIDVPLYRTFTYSVPDDKETLAIPGMRIIVDFKRKKRIGYIIEKSKGPVKAVKIKCISHFPDMSPLLSEKMLKLLSWIAGYYSAPIGEVIFGAIPVLLNRTDQIGKKRREIKKTAEYCPFSIDKKIELNTSQKTIWNEIKTIYENNKFNIALLHGITGSGKTELYLNLIRKVLDTGKQAIYLVPEISLIPQVAGRVASRFKNLVTIYHSGLGNPARLTNWQEMKSGNKPVVVGTRSALFAPFENLGAIIIDEEHDYSYKQDESPRYHARDAAIMRAKFENALVVLGSATPSIETLSNAKSGKYRYFHLSERHGTSKLPEIVIIDMKKEIKSNLLNPYLSITLLSELKKTIKNGHQALLFLNRRGFANFYLCEECGFIPECPNCKITLTYHKRNNSLTCHYCDFKIPLPKTCPDCGSEKFNPVGGGTEMIEDAIKAALPGARIARLDRDNVRTDKKRREILSKMLKGEIDILVGTQMITKGHDFPRVTLVGIVSADQSIHFPDFRASERTFQLLTQVSGRAGRSFHPGKVIVQTYSPDHISIRTASEYKMDDYINTELKTRKELSYPPYSRLSNIKIIGNSEERVASTSKMIADIMRRQGDRTLIILGPAPAPISMIKGKTRWQILLKSASAKKMAESLSNVRTYIDQHPISGIQISIDVDPISTM